MLYKKICSFTFHRNTEKLVGIFFSIHTELLTLNSTQSTFKKRHTLSQIQMEHCAVSGKNVWRFKGYYYLQNVSIYTLTALHPMKLKDQATLLSDP
jgi:hypothetical protein